MDISVKVGCWWWSECGWSAVLVIAVLMAREARRPKMSVAVRDFISMSGFDSCVIVLRAG